MAWDYGIARDQLGQKVVVVQVDGKEARIHPDGVKWTLVEEFNAIFLGSDFEGQGYTVTIPADPEQNRPEMELDGFIQDEDLAKILAREWGME